MVAGEQKDHKKTESGNYVRKWKPTGARKTAKHPGLLSPNDITKKLTWVFRLAPRVNPQNLKAQKEKYQV